METEQNQPNSVIPTCSIGEWRFAFNHRFGSRIARIPHQENEPWTASVSARSQCCVDLQRNSSKATFNEVATIIIAVFPL